MNNKDELDLPRRSPFHENQKGQIEVNYASAYPSVDFFQKYALSPNTLLRTTDGECAASDVRKSTELMTANGETKSPVRILLKRFGDTHRSPNMVHIRKSGLHPNIPSNSISIGSSATIRFPKPTATDQDTIFSEIDVEDLKTFLLPTRVRSASLIILAFEEPTVIETNGIFLKCAGLSELMNEFELFTSAFLESA